MIYMSGIDHNHAPLTVRERFSFTAETLLPAYEGLRKMPGIAGGVIISTCNRTELYIDTDKPCDVFSLLCELCGAAEPYPAHYTLTGTDALKHLCRLACGIESQIAGEDQILTQVKSAISDSRSFEVSSGVLEVFFREAVTAGKRIKTEIKLGTRESSVISKTLDIINAHGDVKKVLVIGNGQIGRELTRTLIDAGYKTAMTLRTYRHGETIVPAGARTLAYDERYTALHGFDALVSATRSPHYTIELDGLLQCAAYPALIIDLAVPRDIDPRIGELPDVTYYDVDSISTDGAWAGHEENLLAAESIISEHISNFEKWLEYRQGIECGAEKNDLFPFFVSSAGKKILLAGGGKIASRRAAVLAKFKFEITVVAPQVTDEIRRMSEKGAITLYERGFEDADLDGCYMVIAATDDRGLNRQIGVAAQGRGILASVADRRDECSVIFPALAINGDVVAGITGGGKSSHHAVAQAARRVREVL